MSINIEHLFDNTILKEKINLIVQEQLAEKRFHIIKKEFPFLDEQTTKRVSHNISHGHKPEPLLVPKEKKHGPGAENNILKPGFRKQNGKVIRIKSLEKFNRVASQKKQTTQRIRHVSVAIRKRKNVLQKQKALGMIRHQKNKALGTTFKKGQH